MRISRSRKDKPTLGVTLGDPSGIGPEVAIKALASQKVKGLANFLLIGSEWAIRQESRALSMPVYAQVIDAGNPGKASVEKGKASKAGGRLSLDYIDRAISLAKEKKIDGIITAPVNKESINRCGVKFPGHTEYLAHAFGVKDYVMLLVGGGIRVAVVTRHIALKDVARKLKTKDIEMTTAIVNKYMRSYFGIKSPAIGICGLNPHSGDGGIFGDEEKRVIMPAIRWARSKRIKARGPIPADSIYFEMLQGDFDAVIAMYHDQGLIPIKTLSRNEGVNATLGLPVPRTSPDHGTAFDIAASRMADPGSMVEAIVLCAKMARSRR